MALGVDLFGYDADGKTLWHVIGRWWNGGQIQDILGDRLKPAEPPPSWEADLSTEEVRALMTRFDPPFLREWYPTDVDLDEALRRPDLARVLLRIEEWGWG